MKDERIPVTIVTGFLGAGKTTLLNRILKEEHGRRIAVIENEFGEAGIDNEILLQAAGERIIEMMNGCICCTVRGDLVRILATLAEKRSAGALDFERVVIETTGLADPAPVVQTFFAEETVAAEYRLDGVVTVVDALHGAAQLDEHAQAQAQVGFADRILVSKSDLACADEVENLVERLQSMNARALVRRTHFGNAALREIFEVNGFDVDAVLNIHPDFFNGALHAHRHAHHDAIGSFVWRENEPLQLDRLEAFLGSALEMYGPDMLRYKGVLNVEGRDERIVFQGVHLTLGAEPGRRWGPGEKRESVLVFIGRNLPQADFERGLAQCVAGNREALASAGT